MSKFSLQRTPMKGQLTKSLKVNLKRLMAGVMATALFITLSSCSKANIDKTETTFNDTSWFYEIAATDAYRLIKLDNKIYFARVYSKDIYHDYISTTLCDVETGEFLGVTIIARKSIHSEYSTTELHDNEFYKGEYGKGKIIPEPATINLEEFVKSEYPSEEDINFWKSNSEEVKEIFDTYCPKDVKVEIENETNEQKLEAIYGLSYFECIKENEKIIRLIGYRTSYDSNDIGYKNIYNVIDGSIYHISNDDFVKVTEKAVENQYSINELKQLYNITSSSPSLSTSLADGFKENVKIIKHLPTRNTRNK